jgi:DNA-binding transcriptional LysR family regulator
VVAEELHFHRAADRLHISQPPLTAAVKSLEDELGVQLLRRNSKMVELTSAGSAFLTEAREILERVSRASSLVRAFDGGLNGRLDIGISGSLLYREVPKIVARFQSEMPTITVALYELSTVEQVDKLMRRQLDAAFVHRDTVPPQLQALPLKPDRFVLCLPEQHPMARKASVDLRDFGEEQFVMFLRDAAPANHDRVIAAFTAAGIHPRTVHSARTWMTIIAMVAHLGGVALVPQSLARSNIHGVRFVPFQGSPASAPAMLVWNPSSPSRQLLTFVECATHVVKPARRAPAR